MASNALVKLTNNGLRDLVFEADTANPANPVKQVSRLALPPNTPAEVEVETVVPMVLFSDTYHGEIMSGRASIVFAFTTSLGVPSTSGNFLANIRRFLAASGAGWSTT